MWLGGEVTGEEISKWKVTRKAKQRESVNVVRFENPCGMEFVIYTIKYK